jgi:AcrR family transcriptional regulator
MWETAGTDRRILRTREAIQDALIDLIEDRGFESISIKDIAERANINRGTFYLHYHDKFDLLEQTENEIIKKVKGILITSGKLNFEEFSTSEEPIPVIVSLFEYFKSRARVIHAVLGLKANPGFQNRMKTAIESNLFNIGFFSQNSPTDLLVPEEYLISYLTAAHLGVVQAWLTNDCRETPQEMAQILARMSFHGPFQAIKHKPALA